MDFFGIEQGVRGAVNIYFTGARQTGRTQSLVDNVRDGDRIVFISTQDARDMERRFKEAGKDVTCVTAEPSVPMNLFHKPQTLGRTILDHRWVEDYYMKAIRRAEEELSRFEKELSHNEPPPQTTWAKSERDRWR